MSLVIDSKKGLTVLTTEPIEKDTDKTECKPGKVEEKAFENMYLGAQSAIFNEAMDYLENATEEEMEVIFKLKKGLEEKLVKTGYVCQKFDQAGDVILSEADVLIKEAEKLKERARIFYNRSDRIKVRMKEAMLLNNIKKIETPLLSVLLRKTASKLVIDPDMNIDEHSEKSSIMRLKKELNRKEIINQLKKGNKIKGFSLSEPDYNLTVKS
jgi:hypothetical protein